jgi:hypothetical protein
VKLYSLAGLFMVSLAGAQVLFQIGSVSVSMSVSTTATQAILQYSAPVAEACTLKAADMNRHITIAGGSQAGGVVAITTGSPHGLAVGAMVYIEETGVAGWDGWQTIGAVADPTHFSFSSGSTGAATAGNVGVLIDDLNPALFPGADLDSRPGNPNSRMRRVFVIGKRAADVAADGNRYTRALQVNSRHHYTLTCGTQDFDQDFTTQNLPLGDTHNDGPPLDRTLPGQYAYPTVQWSNQAQSLIDPLTGLRSLRVTGPAGTASTQQSFQTAIDNSGAWKTPSGPLGAHGAATFTGPCLSGNCTLFLRADNLSLPGGATYTTGYGAGSSLDWVTVTVSNASINNRSCVGDDCKIAACLTVNGVTCTSAEREASLTTTPTSYTLGSASPIDLWQGSGAPGIAAPDVSKASGTVNYASSTRQVTWVSGSPFSVKWTPGSRIMVAGSEYQIASIQSELSLTLTGPGPVGDLYQVPYSANNFGLLIRKKTAAPDQVTIGYATFQYGSSAMPAWAALSVNNCSPSAVAAGGVAGYNCFIDTELYWISADGASVRDLGYVRIDVANDPQGNMLFTGSAGCGNGSDFQDFDPLDGDAWYCTAVYHPFDDGRRFIIVKGHYEGSHAAGSPGVLIPGCANHVGVTPCIQWTVMQPNNGDAIDQAGPAFNSEWTQLGYPGDVGYAWNGVSMAGDILINSRQGAQDTPGWLMVFTLGDRTSTGTGPNSMRLSAAASSFLHPPMTWCVIHTPGVAIGDWASTGAKGGVPFTTALTGTALNATVGVAGGLNTCPINPFSVTGQVCTNIVIGGDPTYLGISRQAVQVGDLMEIDSEYLRVVAKTDSAHLTVQRGYIGTTPTTHSSATLTMMCGAQNPQGNNFSIWNFRADPYGLNANWDKVQVDQTTTGGHTGFGPGVEITPTGDHWGLGDSVCPAGDPSYPEVCYQVRRGVTYADILAAASLGVSDNPTFGGYHGFGVPNAVDSHPGPCTSLWCLDARPMDGFDVYRPTALAGSSSNPFVKVSGQLWNLAGGASVLHPKAVTTLAYVGRSILVDVSGAASSIPTDSSGSYTYCVAAAANECRSGSAAGDIYVNAPFVSVPYCNYPGIAVQQDDTNSICIGPLGTYTGGIAQIGTARQDLPGAMSRRLGAFFSRWNQHGVFWNTSATPSGELAFSQVRWLDGVRHEDLVTVLPPYPASDSVSRNTFVPIDVRIPLRLRGGTGDIVIEFGYAENGGPDSFFCTSRQETCVAASSTVNQASPFYFAQSETYTGVPCTSGCTVEIPALSQRVLYYRWKQRDASGAVIAVSDTQAMVTP